MREIIFLWPTVRPEVMKETYKHWITNKTSKAKIRTIVAVNTQEQRDRLPNFKDVFVVGDQKKGPVHATNVLSKRVIANDGDVVILISDDFYAPKGWDEYLLKEFENFDGCLMVKDGYQQGGCVTIPIMTYSCLLKLNRFIYHPAYVWQFSDAELYHNLQDLGLLRNVRKSSPLFEHRHWACGKRNTDAHDKPGMAAGGKDDKTFKRRMKLPVKERIKR